MDDTAKLVAIILLAAFAIERITAAIGWILDSLRLRRVNDPAAAEEKAKRSRQVALLVIAGVIALGVVAAIDLRILRVLKMTAPPAIDFWLTWLVLLAGADRVRELLKQEGGSEAGSGAAEKTEVPAFRIEIDNNSAVTGIHRVG